MTFFNRRSKYGPNLRAYVVYLVIELRLSNQKISEHLSQVFGMSILSSAVQDIKSRPPGCIEPTYRSILRQIAGGHLVHADETKGVVYGGGHYVWIFTNLTLGCICVFSFPRGLPCWRTSWPDSKACW